MENNTHVNERHPFHQGDYSDIFMLDGNKYYSIFSIPNSQDEKMPCYIDIEFFNITTRKFDFNDRVSITEGLKSNDQLAVFSEMSKWKILYDSYSEATLSSTNSSSFLLQNMTGRKYFEFSSK